MTAAEHLARAEHLLDAVSASGRAWDSTVVLGTSLEAIGHALAAVAIELGTPHAAAPAGGGQGG